MLIKMEYVMTILQQLTWEFKQSDLDLYYLIF